MEIKTEPSTDSFDSNMSDGKRNFPISSNTKYSINIPLPVKSESSMRTEFNNSLLNGKVKSEPDDIKSLCKSDSGLSAEPANEIFEGISSQMFLMQVSVQSFVRLAAL